jgi:Hsp70 protein
MFPPSTKCRALLWPSILLCRLFFKLYSFTFPIESQLCEVHHTNDAQLLSMISSLKCSHLLISSKVGGSTCIPSICQRSHIQDVFPRKTLSTTLNQDGAAFGATFVCAMLSPVFRVRDFRISDYPMKVHWNASPTDPDKIQNFLFSTRKYYPFHQVLSFYHEELFDIEAVMSNLNCFRVSSTPGLRSY